MPVEVPSSVVKSPGGGHEGGEEKLPVDTKEQPFQPAPPMGTAKAVCLIAACTSAMLINVGP